MKTDMSKRNNEEDRERRNRIMKKTKRWGTRRLKMKRGVLDEQKE